MRRLIALILLTCFTFTVTTEGKALAAPASGPSAGGSAGEPSGKILESFHSDLATGRALFSIPLATPPGRRGIQPALGLSYSSAAKNGPVGVGWALELGAIERSTRFGAPKFDATDTFTAQAGGATGDLVQTAPGEYQAKDEQAFAKIRFDGTRWSVTSKDGTIATFGGAPDAVQRTSRGVVAWLLNAVQDIHGNVMTVHYAAYDGQPYPDSIQYTAHPATGLAAAREVRFTWETRPDVESDQRFGDPVLTSRRLQKVEATVSGALVRRYALIYTQSPLTGRSLLESVTTAGTDGVTSLPPVRMSYSNSYAGLTLTTAWSDPDNTAMGGLPFNFISGGRDTGYRFEDLNGDGMPDLIDGSIQCRTWLNTNSGTNAWRRAARWDPPHAFVNEYGGDLGVRFADFNGDGRTDLYYGSPSFGIGEAAYLNTGTGWQLNYTWVYLPPDGSGGQPSIRTIDQSYRDTGMRFVDLNGDGKTDLLQGHFDAGKLHAWINTGSGWAQDDRWAPPLRLIYSDTANNQYDAGCRFVDLNGDGLTDLFYAGIDEQAAYLNTGAGWRRDTSWSSGLFAGKVFAKNNGEDYGWRPMEVNGDGLVDLVQAREEEPFQALINTGAGWIVDNRFVPAYPFTRGGADNGARFADLNGDGVSDLYYGRTGQPSNGKGYCWASAAGGPPAGQTPAAATPPDLLTRVENGIGGTTTLAYAPSSAYDHTGGDGIPDLPFVTQAVASQTISNGMGWSAATAFTYSGGKYDASGREFLGFAYAKATDPAGSTAETWFEQDIHLKGRPRTQETKDAAGNLYSRSESAWACGCAALPPGVHFCYLAATTSTLFDGDATSKQTKAGYTYDAYGNVTQQVEEGDTAVTGDERTTVTEYAYNTSPWLMAYPSHVTVTDAAGQKIGESWVCYDGSASYTTPPTHGLPTKSESWLSAGPANPTAGSTYDAYGNKISSTDTLGRLTTTTYDAAERFFPVQVANALGHTLQTAYDPGTGAVLSTTDPNGQVTQNRYDPLGRITSVIGPLDTDAAPAVRYAYDLSSLPTHVTKQVKTTSAGAYYTTHSFADGLGRGIETRSPAQNPAQQIVTGCHDLGPRGETTAQYMPHFQPVSDAYAPPPTGTPKTLYEYDAMGRTLRVTDPDGAASAVAYNDWSVTATDANGRSITKESDAYGRLIRVTEPATTDHAAPVTQYAYDAAGRLARVTDAKGNVTQIAYDNLGRKISMTDPDMGAWAYQYDAAGNMTQQTDAKGQILEFTYDALNRLTQKRGRPSAGAAAQTLASYAYDAAAKPNCVGRLSKVTDPSGSTEFFYDLLGRETKTVKVIGAGSFTLQREFDTLNRLTRLLYPDGTDVRYSYSPQGITRVHAVNADGSSSDFLSSAAYNPAGETTRLEMGNGAATDFTYNPNTLRIAGIRTLNSTNQTLQDLAYSFDPVGNLTALNDYRNSASQTFQYDALNRLTQASGAYGAHGYRFDAVGNLTQKDNGMTLTYGLTNGSKPHAATKCVEPGKPSVTLTYDPNGNLTKKGTQTFTYDLQNRLTKVTLPTGKTGTLTTTLQPGWNAIGFPFDFKNYSSDTVLSSLAKGQDYDQLSHPPTTPPAPPAGGATPLTLSLGKGFWIRVCKPTPVTLTVSGTTPYPQKSISLVIGFNPIAVAALTPTPLSGALKGLVLGTDYSSAQRWNPTTLAFEALTGSSTVNPGQVLWVNMLRNKTWAYPAPAATDTTTFTYDADGGRVRVTTPAGATSYLGQLYETAPGGLSRAHIFFGPTRIATLERALVIASGPRPRSKLYASLKRSLSRVEEFFVGKAYADVPLPAGTTARFYHGDHLGSVNVVTDHTGAQFRLQEFAPYGNSSRGEGTIDTPHKYTGKRFDDSTGLYYYGARYYDAETGRFTQPDSIVQAPSDPQTLNRYTYCRNNPLIYTDPTGHSFWKSVAKFLGPIGRTIVSAVVAAVTFVGVTIATGGNVHLAAASAAGTFSFTNTFLSASAQGASFGRALGAATVSGAIAFGAVYFGYGAGGPAGAAIGAGFGAAGGAASSAILGGSPGRGALSGAVGGAIMGGLGGAYGVPGYVGGAAAAGAASAAVANGNVGQGAYLGAIGAATFAVASVSLQTAIDAARARTTEKGAAPAEADGPGGVKISEIASGNAVPAASSSSASTAPPLQVDVSPHPAAVIFGAVVFYLTKYATLSGLRLTEYGLKGAAAGAAVGGLVSFATGDPVLGAGSFFAAEVFRRGADIIDSTADLFNERAQYPY